MALVILTYDRNVSDMGLVINCLFALILSTIFGDLAAAAFGKTWGKKEMEIISFQKLCRFNSRNDSYLLYDFLVCWNPDGFDCHGNLSDLGHSFK